MPPFTTIEPDNGETEYPGIPSMLYRYVPFSSLMSRYDLDDEYSVEPTKTFQVVPDARPDSVKLRRNSSLNTNEVESVYGPEIPITVEDGGTQTRAEYLAPDPFTADALRI